MRAALFGLIVLTTSLFACGSTQQPRCTVIDDDTFAGYERVRTIEDPYEVWLFARYIHYIHFDWFWGTRRIDIFYDEAVKRDTFIAVTSDQKGCALMAYTLHWEDRFDVLGQDV